MSAPKRPRWAGWITVAAFWGWAALAVAAAVVTGTPVTWVAVQFGPIMLLIIVASAWDISSMAYEAGRGEP